ncbi:MAG: ABC transporter substrate-binding protein [Acetobacter sp.]|nr:ABC transporter substrate-binding protein [Acetobacter sp.]
MKLFKRLSIFCICLLMGIGCAFMFVGCGNDKNRIRLNEVTHSIFYAPLYAALNLGYFEDEGLNVTLESNDGSHTSMSVLLSGSCEMILAGPETVVYAEETKDRPIVFGQLTQRDGSFIVSKEQIDNFTLDDLKGKTIIGGRYGGLPAMTLQYVIEEIAGLTIGTNKAADEVNLRTDVAFDKIGAEFQSSSSEFCTLFEPTATTMEKNHAGYVVSSVGQFSGSVPYTCFISRSSYLEKYPENAEKFLKAVYRGYKYITTKDSELAAKALQKSFVGMTIEELKVAVEQYTLIDAWSGDLVLTEESFNRLVDIINNATGEGYAPDYSKCVDNSYAHKLKTA